MALSKDYQENERWVPFNFYESGGANGSFTTSIDEPHDLRFGEYRIHFSSAFASTQDLIIYISSAKGSAYNHKLLSQAMSDVKDLRVGFSEWVIIDSTDQLVLSLAMTSGVNVYGMEMIGWAARG